jgi:pyridoxal phosphate enzyme (YggS family)
VAARLEQLRNRIADAGGDLDVVTIVAVTKGRGPDAVLDALAAGLSDVGENYAQELVTKADALGDAPGSPAPRWHFIGQLQRNKVKLVAHHVRVWQSVDRLTVGGEIAKRAPGATVLVQVNLTDDPARGGARPALVPGIVDGLRDLGLDVRGLMAVGPPGGAEAARDGFRAVRELADRLDLPERSIGMTDDLEVGVQEGATMVRIGAALFGPRPRVARPAVEN